MKIKLNVQTIKYDGNVVELEYNSWNNRQCTKIINDTLNKFLNDWVKTTFIWREAYSKLNRLNEIMNNGYCIDVDEVFMVLVLMVFFGFVPITVVVDFFKIDCSVLIVFSWYSFIILLFLFYFRYIYNKFLKINKRG